MSLASREVHLQVVQGPLQGRVYRVTAGSSLTIGRLPDCGITHPEDLTLSRLHAVVEHHAEECWLVNRSSNGTFVNDESIDRIRLQEGDVITCAQLVLKYFGAEEPKQDTTSVWERPTVFDEPDAPACEFAATKIPGGWSWLTPKSEGIARDIGLQRLEELSPYAYLIVDWRRANMEPPPEAPPGQPLFHWLPAESAKLVSPMVLQWTWADWSQMIVEQAAGKDALLWLFSEQTPEDALLALRRATGYGTSSGLLGYCWPSVFCELIKHPGPLVQPLLSAGVAWMIDHPGGWSLAACSEVCSQLEAAGWMFRSPHESSITTA